MKSIIVLLLSILLLSGCSSNTESDQSMFDKDGNLKDAYSEVMQEEWCSHNKGRDFAVEQCEEIWESD